MKYILYGIIVFILLSVLFTGCKLDSKPKCIIKGSTTLLPIIKKAALILKKEKGIDIIIEAQGSGIGIDALINGE